METYKAIEERRSIRKFKKEKVDKSIIEDILNCGRLAPSAKNRQPWYFIVISNNLKNEIADMMIEDVEKSADKNYKETVTFTANIMKESPVLILILKEKSDSWVLCDNMSIGACVENMCLRATELNVGSLWIKDTEFVKEEICNKLGKPNMEVSCALSLGYADQAPKMRPRKNLDDLVEWYND